MADEESSLAGSQVRFIIAFDILNFIALITLSAVLLTAWLSPRIRRVPTWYLYIFTWDIYTVSYLLIIGKQTGSKPVWEWCLFQSVMIYATPILTSTSIVVFVTQIYLDIQSALGFKIPEPSTVKKLSFIPWILFITIICEILVLGFLSPDLVSRSPSGMFCRLDIPIPGQVNGIMVTVCILLMATIGACIALTIRQNRERWQSLVGSREFNSYDLLFRVGVFLVAPVFAIGLVVIKFLPSTHNVNTGGINVLYAILPALVGIVSCSQKDILHVWMFWRLHHVVEDKESQVDCASCENNAVQ